MATDDPGDPVPAMSDRPPVEPADARRPSRLVEWLRPAVYLGNNPITLAGAVLTTSSAAVLLIFWIYELLRSGVGPPYAGIIFFLILPGVFVLGLILMPVGVLLRRAGLVRKGELPHVYPTIDLHQPLYR